MRPGMAYEYELSKSIKKLSVTEKPVVAFLQGHGEASRVRLRQAEEALSVLYNIENIYLTDSTNELSRYQTVAIIAPTDTFPDYVFAQLDEFLNQGKHLLIAADRSKPELQNGYASPLSTRLEQWLMQKGILLEENLLVDKQCGQVNVMQQYGGMNFSTPISFPYLPIISNFGEHPVSKGLEMVILQFASTIQYTGDTSIVFTPFLISSDGSNVEPLPIYFNVQRQWQQRDFPMKNLVVGAAFEGKLGSNILAPDAKLVLFGDGEFALNEEGSRPQPVQPDNINVLVNAIDWLSDETGLVDLRTKAITSRPIKQLEDGKKTVVKYLNFLLPIILIIVYGFYRMQRNSILRIKRMEEGYV
jgi:gliding-associated putative ABC transporter substrate-binding component GldG